MHQRLKERLVGAAVLVVLAVIFIPMVLTGPVETGGIEDTNIPAKPDDKFKPTLVPIIGSVNPAEPFINKQPAADIDAGSAFSKTEDTVVEKTTDSDATETRTAVDTEEEVAPVADTQPVTTSKPEIEKPKTDKPVGLSAWVVQLGSFSSKVNADKLNLGLRKEGFPAFVEPIEQDKKTNTHHVHRGSRPFVGQW